MLSNTTNHITTITTTRATTTTTEQAGDILGNTNKPWGITCVRSPIGCDTGCKPHTLPGIQIPVIYFWYLIYPHIPSHIPRIPSMLPFLRPKSPWKSGYSAAGLGHTRRAMSKMLRQGWTSAFLDQFVEIFWVKPSKNGDLTIQHGDLWLICGD